MIADVFLPISLAIIMLGMGMTLVINDFTRIAKYPKAALIGLTNQLLFLPLIGFALAIVFNLNSTMAIGLMILAACPGGATSNLISQVCRGNIALSVTLTAFASFASILTIPFILTMALKFFGSESDVIIQLPVVETIIQIMGITVIPISIGMIIRKLKPNFAHKMEKPMRIASTVIFILVFIGVIASNIGLIGDAIHEVGWVTLLLNLITMAIGFLSAKLFQLKLKDTISVTIESGIQNGTLAFVIATSILHNTEMALPTGIYSVWMFATGGILMWKLGTREISEAKA